jgi:hypothetical protein
MGQQAQGRSHATFPVGRMPRWQEQRLRHQQRLYSGCVSIGKCISGFAPSESDVGACIGIVAAHEATEVWNGIDKCDKYESHVWIVNGLALADCTLPAKNAKATGFLDEARQVSKAKGDTEVEDADDDKPMQPEPADGIDRLPTNLAGTQTRLTR